MKKVLISMIGCVPKTPFGVMSEQESGAEGCGLPHAMSTPNQRLCLRLVWI
jgi:hypothetical protein